MSNAFWLLLVACFAAALSEYVEMTDDVLDEEMVRALSVDVEEAKVEMATVEAMTMGESARSAKDKFLSLKEKIKKCCKCDTHKECSCTMGKDIKVPIIGTYTLSVTTGISIIPEEKNLVFKVSLGPLNLLSKKVSYVKTEEVCKKIEKFKHLEFCARLKVEEKPSEMRACLTIQANIMEVFNKPLYFPCVIFNGQKMSMDDKMEDVEDDGVKVNLKGLWSKFKGLFSKGKKD